jgi:PDZ domain-containing protein
MCDRVITTHDAPNAMMVAAIIPVTTAIVLPATSAHTLRHHCGRRCNVAPASSTGKPTRARLGSMARDGLAVALAGLRHPAATKPRMARTAIQAVAMVSSLVDTQESIVIEQREEVRSPGRRNLYWAVPLAVIGFLGLIAVAVAGVLPSTLVATKRDCVKRETADVCAEQGPSEKVQFAIVPADAQPVEPRLTIKGPPTYGSNGQLLFVTVRSPELSMLEWWIGRDSPAVSPKSYGDLYATETPQQEVVRGQRDMRTAKETAEYVALKRLGFDAKLTPGEVVIDQLVCLEASDDGTSCEQSAPSDKVLDPGDKLSKLDGVSLSVVDDLGPILARHKPGDKVQVEYERDGETAKGEIELIAAPDEPDRTIVGFVPSDTAKISLPSDVEIDIDTESIGGPSAGLAFTLTLIDQLSPGDLTGGRRVAVTGTIGIEGQVGAIGGLSSKASAVMQAGAKYFLVPTAQGPDDIARAQAVVGNNVEIIPVNTLDEALAALQKIGGDPAPAAAAPTTEPATTTAP